MGYYNRRITSVRFEDAVGFGLDIQSTDGDLSLGESNAEYAEHQPIYDRDVHDGFTLGQDLVMECSLQLHMLNQTLTEAAAARILDFVLRRGSFDASSTTSVDDTIWAWVTIVTFDDGTVSTTRTLPKCEGTESITVGQPTNTIGISFRNHLKPVDA